MISTSHQKYYCHKEIRDQIREDNMTKLFLETCEAFNLDPSRYSLKFRQRVIGLKYKNTNQMKLRQNRVQNILLKLLKEYKRQRQIDEERNKTFDYKVKKKEKIIKDMFVEGTQITLVIFLYSSQLKLLLLHFHPFSCHPKPLKNQKNQKE